MALQKQEAAISVITRGELLHGAEKSRESVTAHLILEELFASLQTLPLTSETATTYSIIRAGLESSGQVIGSNDLWIAAHALSARLILVTNNEREFRRVPGLTVENWAV